MRTTHILLVAPLSACVAGWPAATAATAEAPDVTAVAWQSFLSLSCARLLDPIIPCPAAGTDAGLLTALAGYGTCQTICNVAWVSCYAGAGLVAGTGEGGWVARRGRHTCDVRCRRNAEQSSEVATAHHHC